MQQSRSIVKLVRAARQHPRIVVELAAIRAVMLAAILATIAVGVWCVSVPVRATSTPSGWVTTDAAVTSVSALRLEVGLGGGVHYAIAGKFSTPDGVEHAATWEQVASVRPQIGERLPVIYVADDPSQVRSPPGRTGWSWLAGIVGLALLAFTLRSIVRAVTSEPTLDEPEEFSMPRSYGWFSSVDALLVGFALLVVVVLGALTWGTWSLASGRNPTGWVSTDAVVTESRTGTYRSGKGSSTAYVLVTVEFTTATGQEIATTWSQAKVAAEPFPRRGDAVLVTYDPDNPVRARPTPSPGWPAWGLFAAVMMLTTSLMLFVFGGRCRTNKILRLGRKVGIGLGLTSVALAVLSFVAGVLFGF